MIGITLVRGLASRKSFVLAGAALVASLGLGTRAASANLLVNPGFELPELAGGDTPGAQGWSAFGAAFTIRNLPNTGNQALKVFGGASGIFQDFAATPGQSFVGTAFAANPDFDPMGPGQVAAINIEWHAANGDLLSFETSRILTGSINPANSQYVPGSVAGVAPAGTSFARFVLITGAFADGAAGGAPFFDDATFDLATAVPEPTAIAALGAAGVAFVARRRRPA